MVEPVVVKGTPRKLLLATDLSARCDRALERAVSLTSHWQAQLTVLHVFEEMPDPTTLRGERPSPSWRRPPDAVAIAKRSIDWSLRADLGAAVENASVVIEEGEPADIIQKVATAEDSDLIITGIARERPFARYPVTVGNTVEQLLRRSPTPILIVRQRARAPYERILLASDLSDASMRALQISLRFFPLQPLQLLYAFDVPYASLVPDSPSLDADLSAAVTQELEGFLTATGLAAEDRRRLDLLVERGRPDNLIRAYVNDRHADLVVLGTHGRSSLVEMLVGSVAKSILSVLPCDALLMRALRG